MLRHFFDVPEDGFSATPNNKNKKKAQKPATHNGLESLEERKLLSASPIDNPDDQAIIVNIHGDQEAPVTPQVDAGQDAQELPGETINVDDTYDVAVTTVTMPTAIVTGSLTKGSLRVTITNQGNQSPAASDRVSISVFARLVDAQDDSDDIQIGSSSNLNLNIGLDKSRSYNIALTLDTDLPEGEYEYVVIASPSVEGELSVEISADQTLTAADAFVDLSATIRNSRMGEETISGDGTGFYLPIYISNNGNSTLDHTQTVDITIVARPADSLDSDDDVPLTVVSDQSLGNLLPGQERRVTTYVTLPAGLESDDYVLVAIIDSGNDVEESNEANNEAVTDNSIAVTKGFVNLTADIDDGRLQEALISGNGDRITVPVTVTNNGNIALERGQKISISLHAQDTNDNSIDLIDLEVIEDANVSGLAAGASRTFNVAVTLPTGLVSSDYAIVAIIDSENVVDESNENDNEAVTDATIDVTQGLVNLNATIDDSRLQEALISGNGDRITLPITITNDGNIALDRTQTVDVTIVARLADAEDSDDDVTVAVFSDQNVGNLGAGLSRKINTRVNLPAGLEGGEYILVAIVDSGNDVDESNELDNEAVGDAIVDVTEGVRDLSIEISGSRLQEAMISGNGDRILLPINITNNGNISLATGQTVNITLYARPAAAQDSDDDVVITVIENQNVSALRAGQSRPGAVVFPLPASLETGEYKIVAVVDSGNDVDESNEANNEAVTEATIEVTQGFVNLTAGIDDSRIATEIVEGTTPRLTIPVTINNEGNLNLAAGQRIQVTIVARPVDAEDSDDDVEVVVLVNQNVSGLRAGTSRTLNAVFNLPADLEGGNYNFVAIIDSNDDVEESDEDDNEAISASDINVAPAFVNLTATVDGSRLPEATISGDGTRFIVPVTVTNSGNVAIERGQKINISLHASDTDESYDLIDLEVFENANISGLAAGASRTFNVAVTLPAGMRSENYVILAVVDSDDIVDESNENDNEAVTDAVIAVTKGVTNLSAVIDESRLPESLISGNGDRILLPITITNDGNISLERTQRIDITIVARPADAQDRNDDIQIAVLTNQNVGNLGVDMSRKINASVELPADLETGDYVLVAVLDSGQDVNESNEEDNDAVTQAAVQVTQGVRDLSVTLDDSRIPDEAVTGSNTRFILPVTITNNGNLKLAPGQKVQISVEAVKALELNEVGINIPTQSITVLTFDNANLSNLSPGQSKTVTLAFTLPLNDSFEDGADYNFKVTVDTGNAIEESDEDNNEAETNAVVTVTRGGPNLTAEIDETDIPTEAFSGDGTTIAVPVTITNDGDSRMASGQTVDIDIYIVDADEENEPVFLTTLEDQDISLLRTGASKTFLANVTLPGSLEGGDYRLIAVADLQNTIIESNEGDNDALTIGTIDVTQGSQDLSVAITEENLEDFLVDTNGTADLTVTLTNAGNLSTAADATTQVAIFARLVGAQDGQNDVLLGQDQNVDIGALAADESVEVTFTDLDLSGLQAGEYVLVAMVNDAGLLNVEFENSETTTIGNIEVTENSNDLSNTFDDSTASDFGAGEAGDGNTLTTRLTNLGSTTTPEDATVVVHIYARPVGEGEDILVRTYEGVDVANLATNEQVIFEANNLDLSDLDAGSYRLIAIVDDSGLDLAAGSNNEAQAGSTFTVSLVFDIAASLQDYDSNSLPENFNSPALNTITTRLTNNSSTAFANETSVTLNVYARPTGGGDDILLKENVAADISLLEPDAFVDVVVDDMDLSDLPPGEYTLVSITDDSLLNGASSNNNEVSTNDSFDVVPA